MIPKNALQRRVVELSGKLPAISEKQSLYGFEKCFDRSAVRSRNTLYCLECGYFWKDESVLITALVGCKCPGCDLDLKLRNFQGSSTTLHAYLAVIVTRADFQIVRIVSLKKHLKKGQKADFRFSEVMQHWIGADGVATTLSKQVQGLSRYYDQFVFSSELEVRTESYNAGLRFKINPEKVYPGATVLPIIRRNGFKGHYYGIAPQRLFKKLLTNSYAETLIKSGQIELLKAMFSDSDVSDLFDQIKICIRNKYKVANFILWRDYIRLLKRFDKDVYNAKYICPKNLRAEHDRLVTKAQAIDARRERDRRERQVQKDREKLEFYTAHYAGEKAPFLGLQFQDNDIVIAVIQSVEQLREESELLKHCAFTNAYYSKSKSLLLSCRVKGKVTETAEISLEDLTVVQCRGFKNKASVYNKKILEVINSHLPEIQKIVTKLKRKKQKKQVAA